MCREWEAEANKAQVSRVVILRTGEQLVCRLSSRVARLDWAPCSGIVLDRTAGALGKMLPVFSVFAGGPLGTGQQWFSWVHRCVSGSLIQLASHTADADTCAEMIS